MTFLAPFTRSLHRLFKELGKVNSLQLTLGAALQHVVSSSSHSYAPCCASVQQVAFITLLCGKVLIYDTDPIVLVFWNSKQQISLF